MTGERGQLVLVSGAVVAVAVAALVVGTLALGSHPDVDAANPDTTTADVTVLLDRGVTAAGYDVAGNYTWDERRAAVVDIGEALDPYRAAAEAASATRLITVARSPETARTWTTDHCPGGPGRLFGPCEAIDGVVVQRRANETHLVAVAFDVVVAGDRERTELTVVLRV